MSYIRYIYDDNEHELEVEGKACLRNNQPQGECSKE